MKPAFQRIKRTRMEAAAGKRKREERKRTSRRWRRSAKPKMKMGVTEIKKRFPKADMPFQSGRSEEHTSELQSQSNLVCRLLLEKKKINLRTTNTIEYYTIDFSHIQ